MRVVKEVLLCSIFGASGAIRKDEVLYDNKMFD